jgi:putative membrane protein
MPSERRLHPASILFDSFRHIRNLLVPAVLAMFSTSRAASGAFAEFGVPNVEAWLVVLVVPSLMMSVAKYVSFRMRYEPDELVIRSGILFRNVRHLPYARIQNLDAVQNVFHRLLGVVEVGIETGGGSEPEARIRVLPLGAHEEMRRRVFEGRAAMVSAEGQPPEAAAGPAEPLPEPLLHLSIRELLLCGFLENKGLVIVGAAYGAMWEAGILDMVWARLFDVDVDARGFFRELVRALTGRAPLPAGRIALGLAAGGGFLVLVRLLSMAWAFLRLYDFRLTMRGEDLRAEYGLFTRVTATIPLRRVQTLTIHDGWLHRLLNRASVRVVTAGGAAGAASRDREWVAPIIERSSVPALVQRILPGVDLGATAWQPVHANAFRRAVKPPVVLFALLSASLSVWMGWRAIVVFILLGLWTVIDTRQQVRRMGWSSTDDTVMFKSGWLNRHWTIARVNKVQSVSTHESPLDRRAAMARVRVDTAGAGEFSHRVDIPYLGRDVAERLRSRLAAQAGNTDFRW